ncbi:MAG: efflux RND transporter periplasmic adaptor subunit [Planctomycetaceae bacterium]
MSGWNMRRTEHKYDWIRLLSRGMAFLVLGSMLRADDTGLQVIIERSPFTIRPAATYDIPLRLQALREIEIVALVDGTVLPFRIRAGEKVPSQGELLRLDGRLRQLELDRAAAALEAAKQEAGKGGAAARVTVAQKDVELAETRLDQTIARMPWDGMIYRVHVTEGQFVRAGDPLVTVADPSRLFVDTPIERTTSKVGDAIKLKVEEVEIEGDLTAIMPLSERLDPLRGLFQSVASGRVEFDNVNGQFLPGQTVYSPLIPRRPVGEAPTAAISNSDDGGRKVQVIRDGTVRDIPVQLLGQIGDDYVWISGRFASEDQLILRTSEPLPDGTLVTPRSMVDKGVSPARSQSEQPAGGESKAPVNF